MLARIGTDLPSLPKSFSFKFFGPFFRPPETKKTTTTKQPSSLLLRSRSQLLLLLRALLNLGRVVVLNNPVDEQQNLTDLFSNSITFILKITYR